MSADDQGLMVAFARLEGKVDLTLAEITSLKTTDADHEVRLRHIEALPVPDADTERRMRLLEDRATVSPGQLWAGLVGVLGVVGAAVMIFNGVRDALGV